MLNIGIDIEAKVIDAPDLFDPEIIRSRCEYKSGGAAQFVSWSFAPSCEKCG